MTEHNTDKDENTSFLKGLGITGAILAIIWGLTIIGVALVLDNEDSLISSPLAGCPNAAGDAYDQLQCAVNDLQQNQRINTARVDDLSTSIEFNGVMLGTMMAFFGALITVVVIFFAFRTRNEALAEARLAADEIMDRKESEFDERIVKVQQLLEAASKRVTEIEEKWKPIAKQIDERSSDEKTPLTEDEAEFAEIALAKAAHERTATDWRAIAFRNYENKDYFAAAEAFSQEESRRERPENIIAARVNKAVSLGRAELPLAAISEYNFIIDWAKSYEADDAGVRERVAKARFNKAITYNDDFPDKQPDKAIEGYNALINWAKPYEADDPGVRRQVAMAHFNKAITYTKHLPDKRPDKAIEGYDDLINWAKPFEANDPAVRRQVAMAHFNKAITYTKHFPDKRPEKAIKGYDVLIKWAQPFEADDPAVRKRVAMARLNKATAYTKHFQNKHPNKAIEGYDALIKWAKPYEADDPAVQARIAKARLNKADTYVDDFPDKQPDKAIKGYDALINWAKPYEAIDPAVREQVAEAHFNKATTYVEHFPDKQPDKAIEGYDALIEWAKPYEADDPAVRKRVAKARFNKAIEVHELGEQDDAVKQMEKLINTFDQDQSEDIQDVAKKARAILGEWQDEE